MESYKIKNICQECYFLVCIPLTLIVKPFKTEYQIIKIVPLGFRSSQIWEKCVCSLASSWSKDNSDEGSWIQHLSRESQGSYWTRTSDYKTHSECLNIRIIPLYFPVPTLVIISSVGETESNVWMFSQGLAKDHTRESMIGLSCRT